VPAVNAHSRSTTLLCAYWRSGSRGCGRCVACPRIGERPGPAARGGEQGGAAQAGGRAGEAFQPDAGKRRGQVPIGYAARHAGERGAGHAMGQVLCVQSGSQAGEPDSPGVARPQVPCGGAFHQELQWVAAPVSAGRARLIVSARVVFTRPLFGMRGLIESSSLEARSRMRRSLKQLMRTDVSCGVSQALPACADTTCFKRAACISSRCLR